MWELDREYEQSDEYQAALNNGLSALIKWLTEGGISKDCQENVIDKLKEKGFDLNGFLKYLGRGATFEMGPFSNTPVRSIFSAKGVSDAIKKTKRNNPTAEQYFMSLGDGLKFLLADKASASRLYVLYKADYEMLESGGINNDNIGDVFHEALHGYGAMLGGGTVAEAYTDLGLIHLFYPQLDEQTAIVTSHTFTSVISSYIKQHCGSKP